MSTEIIVRHFKKYDNPSKQAEYDDRQLKESSFIGGIFVNKIFYFYAIVLNIRNMQFCYCIEELHRV